MNKDENIEIIYDENSENIKDRILKVFEKFLELKMPKKGWQKMFYEL